MEARGNKWRGSRGCRENDGENVWEMRGKNLRRNEAKKIGKIGKGKWI